MEIKPAGHHGEDYIKITLETGIILIIDDEDGL